MGEEVTEEMQVLCRPPHSSGTIVSTLSARISTFFVLSYLYRFPTGMIAYHYPTLKDNLLLTANSLCHPISVVTDDGSVEDDIVQVFTCFANDPQSRMVIYPAVEPLTIRYHASRRSTTDRRRARQP